MTLNKFIANVTFVELQFLGHSCCNSLLLSPCVVLKRIKSWWNFQEFGEFLGELAGEEICLPRHRLKARDFSAHLSSHRLQLKTHALFFKWASCSFDSFTSFAYFSEIYELVFSYSLHERENRISELSNFNTRCLRLWKLCFKYNRALDKCKWRYVS